MVCCDFLKPGRPTITMTMASQAAAEWSSMQATAKSSARACAVVQLFGRPPLGRAVPLPSVPLWLWRCIAANHRCSKIVPSELLQFGVATAWRQQWYTLRSMEWEHVCGRCLCLRDSPASGSPCLRPFWRSVVKHDGGRSGNLGAGNVQVLRQFCGIHALPLLCSPLPPRALSCAALRCGSLGGFAAAGWCLCCCGSHKSGRSTITA